MQDNEKHPRSQASSLVKILADDLDDSFERIFSAHADSAARLVWRDVVALGHILDQFRSALSEREVCELVEAVRYHLALATYVLNRIRGYCDEREASGLTAHDAYIFIVFAQEEFGAIRQLAAELDAR